jgi:hypothetical protein
MPKLTTEELTQIATRGYVSINGETARQIVSELIERRVADPQPIHINDTTVARIAGHIAGHIWSACDDPSPKDSDVAHDAVLLARAIVAEVRRTEPTPEQESC